jgi:Repeat of unknown function (DUF5648)
MANILKTTCKTTLGSLLVVLLVACGSNQSDSVDNQLTTGIAPVTKSTAFGQPAGEVDIQAMSAKLGSYFNGKHANNPEALMGAQPTSSGSSSSNSTSQTATPMIAASNVSKAVFRFYNTRTSTHFYTMSVSERDYVQATFPFFNFEGTSFFAYPDTDPTLSPVYRFFNKVTGTHFFTINASEKDHVIATWPDIFNFEGISWYASPTARAGWIPAYRFFNTRTGTHFYTTSAGERDHVLATWSWFTFEGIAYYVRPDATPESPVITVPAPQPQNVKVYISAANTLPAGCNFTYEQCWADSVNNGTVLIINGGGQNYAYYRSTSSAIGLVYVVRPLGTDGKPTGSSGVNAFGVSATQDWVMGTSTGIIKHQATDNTCWDAANNQITCPA